MPDHLSFITKGIPIPLIIFSARVVRTEETDATNENIRDSNEAQTLTYMDITALKASGLDGRVSL